MSDTPSVEVQPKAKKPRARPIPKGPPPPVVHTAAKQLPPRAVRNNNPLNIKVSTARWQGLMSAAQMTPAQSLEKDFCVFKLPSWGFRAAGVALITYHDKRLAKDGSAIDTVWDVIERWAPPADRNDTRSYAMAVARALKVDIKDAVDLHRYDVLFPMIRAMARVEAGGWYFKDEELAEGLRLAGVVPVKPPIAKDPQAKTIAAGGTIAATGLMASVANAVTSAGPAVVDIWQSVLAAAPTVALTLAVVVLGVLGWRHLRARVTAA